MLGKKIIRINKTFASNGPGMINEAKAFILETLKGLKIGRKLVMKAELLCEETIIDLMRFSAEGASLNVRIRRFFGDLSVVLSMDGEEYDPFAEAAGDEEDDISEETIRAILFKSCGESFKYAHKNRRNTVRILTGQAEQKTLRLTFGALALGLAFGFLAKFFLPERFVEFTGSNVLEPAKTMFMNALRIIIAPVVFFSIVSCISQFNSIAELGRLGLKIVGMYLLTTVIAVMLGIGMFSMIKPGEWGFATSTLVESRDVSDLADEKLSIRETVENIVPSNFLEPFLKSDTMQIIFLAVLCGLAVGMTGEYSQKLRGLFEACNSLFLTVTTLISKFIPVAVFCSVSLLIVRMSGRDILQVLGGVGVQTGTIFIMMCVYGLLILIIARINPLKFYKKAREGMITSFTLSSSSAAMPTNLRVCTEKLGISPKVANFSIPLGATLNMDGACIYFCVIGLFLARAYAVTVPMSTLVTMGITVVLLSLGAPGVPGAAFVCLGIVLNTLNVPIEAIGLIIAVNPIMDMFDTMSNCTGDMAAALIVSKKEKLLDEKVYNS
ncbi:MAG: dicarboxylate/amino acid:cation symporter [Ruminococcus sp.]|nr:dicarboxylate/amino acid:cation symporter [Ruminococcus sp.]